MRKINRNRVGMAEATAILPAPAKEERKTGISPIGAILFHCRRITKDEWRRIWKEEPDSHKGHKAMCPF